MVYQNAELMSVPWETIIKRYRKELGDTTFDTLEEYGTNFVAHLNNNAVLFPESVQDSAAHRDIAVPLRGLSALIDETIKAAASKKPISERQIKTIAGRAINKLHGVLKALPVPPDLSPSIEKEILQRHGAFIDQMIANFDPLPLSKQLKNRLREIALWFLSKDLSETGWEHYSGLVVAGFGAADLYPSVMTFRVDSVVLNQLKYGHLKDKSERITASRLAKSYCLRPR